MIDDISSNFDIDSNIIYACGMSNCGYMSYRLACDLSDKITAFGSVTGNFMLNTSSNDCEDQNREIPIISDTYIDQEFGTGALKVTPAHDINDYEIGKKNNMEIISVIDKNGNIAMEFNTAGMYRAHIDNEGNITIKI